MVGKGLIRCVLVAAFLIAVMNVTNARAQGRHRGMAGSGMAPGVAPVFVIGHEAVQKELGLKPDQVDRIKALVAEFREEWQHSNIPGSNYAASIWLMGVRLQR